MPVIQSAKKQMRQALKRRERNAPHRNELKTVFKKQMKYITDGKLEEAVKFMPTAFSVIDMCLKRNLIHKNNAANKKSRLALALSKAQKGGVKAEKAEAKA
ncbi:30S ribosomal protein S20 [Candidatus Gracilibacteria bacterium]|jgi:small subunit ribosomal protein S20|nr:30S ribosomal protein S20 [Candidatus Gracilibacteria bacterium]